MSTPILDLSGQPLSQALDEQAKLSISFYSYGCILRKQEGDRISEYPVDPSQIAMMLSTNIQFDTGIMNGNTLLIRENGAMRTLVGFRKRQKTGIWLEGSEDALRLPLPDLLMIRRTTDNNSPEYKVYATKGRPTSLDAELFDCPLPNVYKSASICWGSVKRVKDESLQDNSLETDFAMLLGSPFGNHATHGKSHAHPSDVRKMLIELEGRNARVYPRRDLVSARTTLAQELGDV